MRRESSTVVVLPGETDDDLLAALARSQNVSVTRAPDDSGAGWEPGALAMREAARRRSTYVVVPVDPLAEVAARWQAMWDVAAEGAVVEFEAHAADALAAWRDKRFELPDYYLVLASAQSGAAGPDLYLGPLRAVRPRRVAVAVTDAASEAAPVRATRILGALRSLEHGPWWPPLDELIDAARRFYPGALAPTP